MAYTEKLQPGLCFQESDATLGKIAWVQSAPLGKACILAAID